MNITQKQLRSTLDLLYAGFVCEQERIKTKNKGDIRLIRALVLGECGICKDKILFLRSLFPAPLTAAWLKIFDDELLHIEALCNCFLDNIEERLQQESEQTVMDLEQATPLPIHASRPINVELDQDQLLTVTHKPTGTVFQALINLKDECFYLDGSSDGLCIDWSVRAAQKIKGFSSGPVGPTPDFEHEVAELEKTVFTLPGQYHDAINFCDTTS